MSVGMFRLWPGTSQSGAVEDWAGGAPYAAEEADAEELLGVLGAPAAAVTCVLPGAALSGAGDAGAAEAGTSAPPAGAAGTELELLRESVR